MAIRDIIASAARMPAILASGEAFEGIEADDALEVLQSIILEHPGLTGARWWDQFSPSGAAITAREGQRITVGAYDPVITLPTTTSYWGSTRAMPPLARIQVVGGTNKPGLWLWSSEWRRADALTLDSLNPFGDDTNRGLAAQLAKAIAEEYGASIGPVLNATAMRSEKMIRARLYRAPACGWQDDYQFPQHPFDPFA